MNRYRCYILFYTLLYGVGLNAQYTAIPDPIFEEFLMDFGFDDVADGQVLTASISNISSLQINEIQESYLIEDFTGIQDFVGLVTLDIGTTLATSIDFGDLINLDALILMDNDLLTHIDVSGLVNLEILVVGENDLIELDVSNNYNLRILRGSENNIGGIIDVSNLPSLEQFSLALNNIEAINLQNGANTNITFFQTFGNPDLSCILVDDVAYSEANWTSIDTFTSFVDTIGECELLSTFEPDAQFSFRMYPNPAATFFSIQSNDFIKSVMVYDLQGKLAAKFIGTRNEYPIAHLTDGLYMVEVVTTEGTFFMDKLLVH